MRGATAGLPATVYQKALYDRRWGLVAWMVTLWSLAVLVGSLYQVVGENPAIADMLENLPESARLVIAAAPDLSTPAGFYDLEMFNFTLPLVVSIVVILQGVGAVAGEEQAGTLDLLLSVPISRRRTVAESFGAVATSSVLLASANAVGMLAAGRMFDLELTRAAVVEANVALALFGVAVGSGALAAGSWIGRRGRALGLVALGWLASYLVYAYSDLSAFLDSIKGLSLFYVYQGAHPVVNGLSARDAAALMAASLAFLGLGILGVNRRDLGVA